MVIFTEKQILMDIYILMNDFSDNVCVPFDLVSEEVNNLVDLTKKLDDVSWKYYDDKNLFDYSTQLGYTEYNFKDKFKEKCKEIAKLVRFIEINEDESEEHIDE